MIKCGECVRHDNCWLYDEHKDDNGTCVWAESKSITESPNEEIKRQNDVIEIVRCKDCLYKQLMDEGDTKYYYCALEDRPNRNWSVDDTDFCSWGERKEE